MTAMVRDDLAVNNERVKLLASFANALGIGLIGVGVLAPLATLLGQVAGAPAAVPVGVVAPVLGLAAFWLALGVVLHGAAHYVLGRMKKAAPDEPS